MAENSNIATTADSESEDFDYEFTPLNHRKVNTGNRTCEIYEYEDELYGKLKNLKTEKGDCQEDRRNITLYEVDVIPNGSDNLCMPPVYTLGPFKLNAKKGSKEKCEIIDEFTAGEDCFCRMSDGGKIEENKQAECFCQIYTVWENRTRKTSPEDFYPYRRVCNILKTEFFTETPYVDKTIVTNNTKWLSTCSLAYSPFDFEKTYFELPLSEANTTKAISDSQETNTAAKETMKNNSAVADPKGNSSKLLSSVNRLKKIARPKSRGRKRVKVIIKVKPKQKVTEAAKRRLAAKLKELQRRKNVRILKKDIKIVTESKSKTNSKSANPKARLPNKNAKSGKKLNKGRRRLSRSAEFSDEETNEMNEQAIESMLDSLSEELSFDYERKEPFAYSSNLIPVKDSMYSATNQNRKLLSLSQDKMNMLKSDNLNLQPMYYIMPITLAFMALFYLFAVLKKKIK